MSYIPVHVPEQHHEAMLAHLLNLLRGDEPVENVEHRAASQSKTPEHDETLHSRFQAAWPDLRDDQWLFFSLLADRHGEWVAFDPDVVEHFESSRAAQNMTISLTPRLRRNGIDPWPIAVREESGTTYYKMDDALADVVFELIES